MAYQSKTYSLSDEVVAAIDAARASGISPNRYLRHLLGIDPIVSTTSEKVAEVQPIVKPPSTEDFRRGIRPKGDTKR